MISNSLNFLTITFSCTSLPCCPESQWVQCLIHTCSTVRLKMKVILTKKKKSVCSVSRLLGCLCILLYPLFALNNQRRSIREQEQHEPTVTGHTLNSLHMYVIYAVHVCILTNYEKKNVDFITTLACFKSCHSVFVQRKKFHCNSKFLKVYQLCTKEFIKK